ncbi:MAG: nucleotidyltransferase domain-containing protein [Candidatus Hodarchaeota archaeon]
MAKKPIITGDRVEIVYSPERWEILRGLRRQAKEIMNVLASHQISSVVHGSVARGDVSKESDVDILIPSTVSSFKVELALKSIGYSFYSREIVQATPGHSIKAHIYLNHKTVVTFPLIRLRRLEYEFYMFGGTVAVEELDKDVRVEGVDKRLMLIEPTDVGHIESPIIGNESTTAKILGVSVDIVNERIRVLTKRDERGRTGIFLKHVMKEGEVFEEILKQIGDRDPVVKRRLREEKSR